MLTRFQTITDPRVIKARFISRCLETGYSIRRGELCAYDPRTRGIYHITSPTGQRIFHQEQNLTY